MKTVIVIPGGGVRGIGSIRVLCDLAFQADMVAGTSTGAIIAALLATGWTPSKILELYKKEIKNVFDNDLGYSVISAGGLAKAKYDSKNLDRLLNNVFGDLTIKKVQIPLLINAVNITRVRPKYFNSWQDWIKIKDAVRASVAAPTYFMPAEIEGEQYIDGGVDVNNLCMSAYVEAQTMWPDEDIHIISLGVGDNNCSYHIENGSAPEWLKIIIKIMMSMNNESAKYILKAMINKSKTNDIFSEYNLQLEKAPELDDVSDETIRALLKEGVFEKKIYQR